MSDDRAVGISVVIVTYNSENEIVACLDSLLEEVKGFSSQVVIVDNNSTDSTLESLDKIKSKWCYSANKLELITNNTNLGFTKALNQGLKKCRGNYILTLNPDTVLQVSCITKLANALNHDDKIGIVAPQLLNPDGSIQPSCRRFPRRQDVLWEISGLSYLFRKSKQFNRWKMGEFKHLSRLDVDQPQGACLLFRRMILDSVGYWDESFPMFFSDVDWCKRVKSEGYKILFEPAAKVVHHKGVSVSRNRAKMIWTSHRSFYEYFKKHKKKFLFVNEIFGVILFVSGIFRIVLVSIFDRITKNR